MADSLASQLSALDEQLLPQLLPALQAYTRAAAAAGGSRSLAERDWQAAEAAVCGDVLQLFVTAGCIAAAAAVCGQEAADELSGWMGGPLDAAQQEGQGVWQLLSQHVATTLRGADRAFLLAAVDRANAGMDATGERQQPAALSCCASRGTAACAPGASVVWGMLSPSTACRIVVAACKQPGSLRKQRKLPVTPTPPPLRPCPPAGVDALGALLALCLSGVPPPAMAAAAFASVLQHPELTAALTAAEGVDEEALEEQQQAAGPASDSGDAAALLEQVGVRPELAAAVAGSPGSGGFFTGWALLMAHVLAAPADSHGRRLLAQSVKEAHALVPALMDALIPLLPLDSGSGGRRRDSSGSAGPTGGGTPGGTAAAAAGGSGGSSGGGGGASFASQLAELGPFPSGHSGDLAGLPPAEQRQAQRFAALLYAAVLQALPASSRLWFADLRDRGTVGATERYTSAAVSGQLLAAELAAVTEV